jgi:hypothetical protein
VIHFPPTGPHFPHFYHLLIVYSNWAHQGINTLMKAEPSRPNSFPKAPTLNMACIVDQALRTWAFGGTLHTQTIAYTCIHSNLFLFLWGALENAYYWKSKIHSFHLCIQKLKEVLGRQVTSKESKDKHKGKESCTGGKPTLILVPCSSHVICLFQKTNLNVYFVISLHVINTSLFFQIKF